MMTWNKAMLWVVTAMAVAFLFFPNYVGAFLGGGDGKTVTENMNRAVLEVEGMTCEGCSALVAKAIRGVPGVLAADVDYHSGRAVVGTATCCPIPREEILAALEKMGYTGVFVPCFADYIILAEGRKGDYGNEVLTLRDAGLHSVEPITVTYEKGKMVKLEPKTAIHVGTRGCGGSNVFSSMEHYRQWKKQHPEHVAGRVRELKTTLINNASAASNKSASTTKLHDLNDIRQLREAFNAASGSPRLVLLLSPT